jgi:phosphoglycolate phosphatase-like HAD superfamily hydrolase
VTGVADLIDERASSTDAERSKPDPDIVNAALGKACLRPDEAELIGDTRYDVEAGGGWALRRSRCAAAVER